MQKRDICFSFFQVCHSVSTHLREICRWRNEAVCSPPSCTCCLGNAWMVALVLQPEPEGRLSNSQQREAVERCVSNSEWYYSALFIVASLDFFHNRGLQNPVIFFPYLPLVPWTRWFSYSRLAVFSRRVVSKNDVRSCSSSFLWDKEWATNCLSRLSERFSSPCSLCPHIHSVTVSSGPWW